ncbi:unnamed protein product [Adineta ricciae]|uniref:Uncharacterized protein n=1 Tax=Adineta ricciae TaxID=249248 RepID=A0A813ZVB6_ADIRI|nr:unnamed protein product [Adineta ricciae]
MIQLTVIEANGEFDVNGTDNVLDSSVSSLSNSNKSLNRSSSNPDLSSSSISNKSITSSTSTFSGTINDEDNLTFVVKVYRSDQSFKYFPVLKSTTAKQLVMLAITEFSIVDQSSYAPSSVEFDRLRYYSLCEVSVENNVIKQKRLPDNIDNLPERLPINARYYLKNNHLTETLVPDHLSNELIREARIHFLQLDSLEICAQLTLRDFAIFKSILPTEYIDHVFKLKSAYGIPHLEKFLRLPNQEMYWTITEIIRETNLIQRSKIVKHFIKIAKCCKDMKNFNSMFAIISGLDHKTVQRLQATWERVPEKYKKLFEELKSLLDISRNMSVYRNLLKNEFVVPPIIPMFPVCMKDLTFIHLGNQTQDNDLINFEKLRMIAKEIRYIVNMSSSPYDISNMFDSPTSHSQIFAGFGHQSSTDSYGTIRRHQTGMRLSVAANAKRIYDEALMVKKVKTYLNNAEIIEDEDRLLELANQCEPVSTLKRRPSPSTSSLSSNSSCDRRGGSVQLTKFESYSGNYEILYCFLRLGTQSPDAVNKLLRLSDSNHQIKSRAPQKTTPILRSASPLINNSVTLTGLTSTSELTQRRYHQVAKMRDANKLTSESSSLNLKPASSVLYIRSHIKIDNPVNNELLKNGHSDDNILKSSETSMLGHCSEKSTTNLVGDGYLVMTNRNRIVLPQMNSEINSAVIVDEDVHGSVLTRTWLQRSKSHTEVTLDQVNFVRSATPYKDCGSALATVQAFEVTDCAAAPCKFIKGHTYAMNLTFQAKEASKSATVTLHGIIGGIPVPFPIPDSNACNLGVKCPVAQSDVNVGSFSVPVLQSYPSLSLYVKIEVIADDQKQDYVCLQFPATIVAG